MHLTDAANIMTPAYLAILSKGFNVSLSGDLMIAQKEGQSFSADGPVAFLGLIAMVEIRGETWQTADNEIGEFVGLFG